MPAEQMLFLDNTGALNVALLGTGLSIGAGPTLELATNLQQVAGASVIRKRIDRGWPLDRAIFEETLI